MFIENPDLRYSFIDSGEAASFLYSIAKSDFQGSINPGSEEDCSLSELISFVEELVSVKANLSEKGDPSPYNLPGSWSVNTDLAQSIGFKFSSVDKLLRDLIIYYS